MLMFWADLGLMRDWSALKNSLQWPVYTINSDDKTNYLIKQTTGVAPHFFFFIKLPLCSFIMNQLMIVFFRVNRLSSLPRGLGTASGLEILDLTYNNLNEKSLPGNFSVMSKFYKYHQPQRKGRKSMLPNSSQTCLVFLQVYEDSLIFRYNR